MSIMSKVGARLQFTGYAAYASLFRWFKVTHADKTFILRTNTANEAHRGFTFSKKEPETLAWIDVMADDSIFFDVGANIGIYSLYASKRLKRGQVYAFEPDSQSYASLCANAFKNRSNNPHAITPYQFAISSRSGIGTLQVSRLVAGAGAAALDAEYGFVRTKPDDIFHQGIATYSLDDLVGTYGLPQPDFLKIDVDGIEEDILAGAQKVLADPKLKGLLVEFQYRQESDLKPAFDRLAALGLHLRTKSAWVAEFEGTRSQNFIFGR